MLALKFQFNFLGRINEVISLPFSLSHFLSLCLFQMLSRSLFLTFFLRHLPLSLSFSVCVCVYVLIIQLTLLHFFSLTSLLPYYNRHYLFISLFFSLLFVCICCLYLFLLMFVCVCVLLSHPLRLSLFLFLQKN